MRLVPASPATFSVTRRPAGTIRVFVIAGPLAGKNVTVAVASVARGDIQRGLEIGEGLLHGVAAEDPTMETSLGGAAELSHLYQWIARMQRRGGKADRAAALDARRSQLWQHWSRKLPDNQFVMARLTAARIE